MANSNSVTPFCHRLSRLGSPSPLDPAQKTPFQIVDCQGPRCAIFIMDIDENGQPTGRGHCADTVNAITNAKIAAAIEAFVSDYLGESEDEDETPPIKDPPATA